MAASISGHLLNCDLVTRPDTGPLRGWVCSCRTAPASSRHGRLRERLVLLGFSRKSGIGAPFFEFWVGGANESILLPLDAAKGDYAALCRRVELALEPYERVFAAGERAGMQAAMDLLAVERDQVDQRFQEGLAHGWSVLLRAMPLPALPSSAAADSVVWVDDDGEEILDLPVS